MITTFITAIGALIVAGLLYWLVLQLPLPAPFPTIIRVLVILALIIFILHLLVPGAVL